MQIINLFIQRITDWIAAQNKVACENGRKKKNLEKRNNLSGPFDKVRTIWSSIEKLISSAAENDVLKVDTFSGGQTKWHKQISNL